MIPQTKIEQAAKKSNNGVAEAMTLLLNAAFEDGVRFAESEMGQIAQEFDEWKFQNYKPVLKYGLLDFWRSKRVDSRKYTTSDLFAKFMAERSGK